MSGPNGVSKLYLFLAILSGREKMFSYLGWGKPPWKEDCLLSRDHWWLSISSTPCEHWHSQSTAAMAPLVAVSSGSWGQRYSHRQRAAFLPVAAQALWLQPKWEKQLPVHISFPKFLGLLQLKIPFTKSRTMKGIFYISFNPSDTPQGRHSHYHFRKVN